MKEKKPVRPVKRKPYPFAVLIKVENLPQPLRAQASHLTPLGMLLKLTINAHFRVGGKFAVEFDIPSTAHQVNSAAKVIKTYDSLKGENVQSLGKEYMLEIHFLDLPSKHRESIEKFVAKIGQKK
jgi:c-di-GMP-binding flagellar brake protein YcgR